MNSMRGHKPHCCLKIYEIGGQSHLGEVPKWLKTLAPKADQVWAALKGVDPTVLRELFAGPGRLYAMVPGLERCYREERNCALIRYRESAVGRAQARSERPRRKEQKRQAKAARKRRAIERQLQAPCQNSVEDSGPGGRGGRVSTTRSELISSEPSSGDPNDEGDGIDNSVWNLGTVDCPYELDRKEASTVGSETDSGDGNDCTDET